MHACPVCGSARTTEVLTIPRSPVFVNQLCHTQDEARRSPRAEIALAYCPRCQHLFNQAFDPGKLAYGPDYENSLHFSPQFQTYADALADDLVRRYALFGKCLVEVGCGRGDFLAALCQRAGARGFGFDPSAPGEPDPALLAGGIEISRAAYGPEHANLKPNLLVCRHCLEHVADPVSFLTDIAQTLGPGSPVFFEVPNGLFTLEGGGIWDIIYEHPSYFTPASLRHAFGRAGFSVGNVERVFGDQFLTLHAQVGGRNPENPQEPALGHAVDAFAAGYRQKLESWRARLGDAAHAGKKIVVWGAGSKGASFLNSLDEGYAIDVVVDVNPRKHGKFVVGTGHPIVHPDALKDLRPDLVVVMNPVYRGEIAATLDALGVDSEIVCA